MPFVQSDNNYKPEIVQTYTSFNLAHQYDRKLKIWVFKGYTCNKCGKMVQNPNIVPKHSMNCKRGKPTVYMQEPDPEQIVNVRGEPWVPYETNQKKSDINTI